MKSKFLLVLALISGLSIASCKEDADTPFVPSIEGPYDRVKVSYKIIDSTRPSAQVSLTLQKVKIDYINFNFNSVSYDKSYAAGGRPELLLNVNSVPMIDNTVRKEYVYEDLCDEDWKNCTTITEYSWQYPDLIAKNWSQSVVTRTHFEARIDLYEAGSQYKYFVGQPTSVEFQNEAAIGYNSKLCFKAFNGTCGSRSYSEVSYDRDINIVLIFDLKDFQ